MRFTTVALLLLLGWLPAARANDRSAEREVLEGELAVKYPKPPKTLDTDPAVSSVLLVDFDLEGIIRLNGIDGAALVKRDGEGGPIRAGVLKGRLVMFHTLEPGTYSLEFVRLSNYNANLVLQVPSGVEIDVTVDRGQVAYLPVVLTKRVGPDAPDFRVAHDAHREIEAWAVFKKKYADSPWTALADKRIGSLASTNETGDRR
jgi:hypothetical protein